MGTTYPSDPVCRDCGDKDADCLTSDRVRVCVSCLHERAANERDALRLEVAGLAREVVDLRKARFRGDVCGACGKPTSVGKSFDGPCPHDTDLACALWQRDEARELLANVFDRFACAACSHGKTTPDCPCGFHAVGAYLDRTEPK